MTSTLPPPSPDQPFWTISAVEAGELSLPVGIFVPDPYAAAKAAAPSLSFLLRHSTAPHTVLFDLGMRKDYTNYPPAVVQRIETLFQPVTIGRDVRASLEAGGLPPDGITHVVLSHVHWDHVGDPAPFARASFVVGKAAARELERGFPADPKSLFTRDLLPAGRTELLDPEGWAPLGPFPRARDYFGDGSLYIVDAPGHMPGHINVLARTSADGGWAFLAGDSAHDWRLVAGEAAIPHVLDTATGEVRAAHVDVGAAEAHLGRIRALLEVPRVRVLLAHDAGWYKENKGGKTYWPGAFESL